MSRSLGEVGCTARRNATSTAQPAERDAPLCARHRHASQPRTPSATSHSVSEMADWLALSASNAARPAMVLPPAAAGCCLEYQYRVTPTCCPGAAHAAPTQHAARPHRSLDPVPPALQVVSPAALALGWCADDLPAAVPRELGLPRSCPGSACCWPHEGAEDAMTQLTQRVWPRGHPQSSRSARCKGTRVIIATVIGWVLQQPFGGGFGSAPAGCARILYGAARQGASVQSAATVLALCCSTQCNSTCVILANAFNSTTATSTKAVNDTTAQPAAQGWALTDSRQLQASTS